MLWQDPLPRANGEMLNETDIAELKQSILAAKLSIAELVATVGPLLLLSVVLIDVVVLMVHVFV